MEKRIINNEVEIREADGKNYITGYGILFNSESQDLGGFTEIIEPSALRDADMTDVVGRAEHTNSMLLGRTSSGTMTLEIDERGVKYSIEVPNTTAGKDTLEYIRRGDMKGSSFAFSGVKDTWEKRENGVHKRTITGIRKIHDIGPVVNPAYLDTTAAMRSLEKFEEKEEVKETPKEEIQVGLTTSEKVKVKRLKG